jgi:hypothetical protein
LTTRPDSRSYPPTRLAFHASRIVIDIGVLLVLGAMSLPFVSAEGFGQRSVAADALPALLLMLPIFVITLLPDQSRPVPTLFGWLSLVLAATALPYAIVKYLDASSLAHTVGGGVGAGAWMLVAGGFVTLAGIVYGLVRALLHLPVGGTYPARPESPAAAPVRRVSAGAPASPPPAAPPRPPLGAPPLRRSTTAAPGGPSPRRPIRPIPPQGQPAPGSRVPAAPPQPTMPAPAPSPRPLPADPDTEPTLPSVRKVRHWWPDDLEDLFD